MSQLDRFLLAFRRDVLNSAPHGSDHYAQLYWDDRDAFYALQAAAWSSGQPEPFITMAKVQAQNEDVGPKGAMRLARRLLLAERFREAEQALLDPRSGMTEHATGLLDFAWVQLGLGRLERAAAALAQARAIDPGVGDAGRLDAAIARIRAAEQAAVASRAWPEMRALFDRWIEVGAMEAGLRVLMRVATTTTPFGTGKQFDFHEALDIVLSNHRPASLYNLFRALCRITPSKKERADLQQVAGSLAQPALAPPSVPATWTSHSRMIRTSAALAWEQMGELEAAVDALGQLTVDYPKNADPRAALARVVGRSVLEAHPLKLSSGGPRKVIDVFPFNNELRLLDLKLREMADWVDAFVIVEARQTFTGAPKPLVFQDNRAAFSAFDSKIVHVVVDAFPAHVRHPWSREFYQRDMGVVGMAGLCGEDDVVLITDADELVTREAIARFERDVHCGYARLFMERARYFLNYREALAPGDQKDASSIWRGRYLSALGLSYARNVMRWDKKAPRLRNTGWHFTSVGGATTIASKLKNSAHQEHSDVSADAIESVLAEIRAGRLEPGWERCELDERFPAYVRSHPQMFEDVLL